ncbi:hypothetical protein ABZ930_30950 [Streptomyces sp. NPDC046716]|uniref:hypothetical protein n=1 Tax=Streptomyces sp. NPDC046716 TaxID=3157093 RepID=UPI0033D5DBDD
MADEEEISESAETHDDPPVEEPAGTPDPAPRRPRRLRHAVEMTYWVLMIGHYGIPYLHESWTWMQDHAFPLINSL